MSRFAKEEEEAPPDTEPVPTPPLESGERNADVTVVSSPTIPSPAPRRRYKRRRRAAPAIRPIDDILADIEKKEGNVPPALVMILMKSYRSLEATNRAQKELIRKIGRKGKP
jgi:hypothetical protein